MPLEIELEAVVHSIGLLFGPTCIDPTKCTLPVACSSSLHEDSRLALPLILPVHSMSAVMPLAFLTRLVKRQPLICGRIAPYFSKYCCVTQTGVVCGPPPVGSPTPAGNGDCCHVVVVVNAHRPGFLVCAGANTVISKRQPTNVIQRRVLRMISPVWSRKHLSHTPTSAIKAQISVPFVARHAA